MKQLGLINYEGYVISLSVSNHPITGKKNFLFIDQWGKKLIMGEKDLVWKFIIGSTTVFDSKGKGWNWLEQPGEALTDSLEILKFIEQ